MFVHLVVTGGRNGLSRDTNRVVRMHDNDLSVKGDASSRLFNYT